MASWGQSRVTLSPDTKGISGMQQDNTGGARTDTEQPGTELAPNLEQPSQGGNYEGVPTDMGGTSLCLQYSPVWLGR